MWQNELKYIYIYVQCINVDYINIEAPFFLILFPQTLHLLDMFKYFLLKELKNQVNEFAPVNLPERI